MPRFAHHRVQLDGDAADGVAYCVARHYREKDGTAEVIALPLRYFDTSRRTPDGGRFWTRELRFTWVEKIPADIAELATWTGQGVPELTGRRLLDGYDRGRARPQAPASVRAAWVD